MARITSVTQRQFTVTSPDQATSIFLPRNTFVIGTGFNSDIRAMALQSDGKILMGGLFTTYNGTTQNRITRLNADGTRDTGFTIGTGFNSEVYAITLQPDGKILVGGAFTSYNGTTQNYITRLNADGTRDTGFSIGTGLGGGDPAPFVIAVQPDGKILVGGSFTTYNGTTQNRITRLNADGTRDTGFTIGTGFSNPVRKMLLQSDGKILVCGVFSTYNEVTVNRIVRLNTDGTRDTSFSTEGTGFGNIIRDIALQSDGKIIVGGEYTTYNGIFLNRIQRLNADGTRDTGFSIGTGFNGIVYAIALQSDGKILVGGDFTSYNGSTTGRIARLNTDGSRDTGFVTGTGFGSSVWAVALQPDGNILVGGNFLTYISDFRNRIIRITSSGSIQPETLPVTTYAVALPQFINTALGWTFDNNTIFSITLQSGKILVGGSFTQTRLTRLTEQGFRDDDFQTGLGFNGIVYTMAFQPDGKIVVGGSFTTYQSSFSLNQTRNRIIRLTADGDIDYNFVIGTGFNINPFSIAVQPDGKILVGGSFTTYNGTTQNCITRLNADGTRDTGFSSGTGFSGGNGIVYTITLQPDGKILVGGSFTTYNGTTQNQITRLNADGTRDTGFSSAAGFGDGAVYPLAIAVQPDGKILVGGLFLTYDGVTQNCITRLNADGTRDTGFSIGTGFNDFVRAIALQPDGKILVGGSFTTYNGVAQNRITRLNADGTRDTNVAGVTGFNNSVYAITLQPDGKILVGGAFTSYNGVTQNRICMLNVDGTLSTTLDIVREGSQYNFAVTTANVRNGTVLRWRILDRPNDFAVNTNTVTVTSNTASITVTPTADLQTEGAETFRVQLEKITGTIVGITSAVTINDISLSP